MTTNRVTAATTVASRLRRLYHTSGLAAMMVGALFLIAMTSLIVAGLAPGAVNGWLSLVENNWLVVLFKLNAGLNGVSFEQLRRLNALDIAILVLVATAYLGLYAALNQTSRIWTIIAAIIPFLGIALFITTELAGRSGVMGAGLVFSFVMLRSNIFGKMIAFMGILANALVLVGDITTANSPSNIVALVLGVGYVLLMTWFFLVGGKLLQL